MSTIDFFSMNSADKLGNTDPNLQNQRSWRPLLLLRLLCTWKDSWCSQRFSCRERIDSALYWELSDSTNMDVFSGQWWSTYMMEMIILWMLEELQGLWMHIWFSFMTKRVVIKDGIWQKWGHKCFSTRFTFYLINCCGKELRTIKWLLSLIYNDPWDKKAWKLEGSSQLN